MAGFDSKSLLPRASARGSARSLRDQTNAQCRRPHEKDTPSSSGGARRGTEPNQRAGRPVPDHDGQGAGGCAPPFSPAHFSRQNAGLRAWHAPRSQPGREPPHPYRRSPPRRVRRPRRPGVRRQGERRRRLLRDRGQRWHGADRKHRKRKQRKLRKRQHPGDRDGTERRLQPGIPRLVHPGRLLQRGRSLRRRRRRVLVLVQLRERGARVQRDALPQRSPRLPRLPAVPRQLVSGARSRMRLHLGPEPLRRGELLLPGRPLELRAYVRHARRRVHPGGRRGDRLSAPGTTGAQGPFEVRSKEPSCPSPSSRASRFCSSSCRCSPCR
jgi:hypothetical protein